MRVNFRACALCATCIASLLSASCIRPAHAVRNIGQATWLTSLGDAGRTPFLAERVPTSPTRIWDGRLGRGYSDVPYVDSELLIAGSTAKTITVVNAATGSRYWERRVNGAIMGAVLRRDDKLYVATQSRDGRVEALRLGRGSHAWTFRMHSPAAGGALMVDSILYTGSERADVFAIHIADASQQWRTRLPTPIATTPVAWNGRIVVITTRDSLILLDRQTGTPSPGLHLPGSVSAPVTVVGDRLIIAVQPGRIMSVNLSDMKVEWTATTDAPVLTAPAVDTNGDVYVMTHAADVYRIEPAGAAHRIAQLGGAAAASLSLTADGLLAGKLDGTLIMLRRDGTEVWRQAFTHSIRTPVAVRNGAVYVPLGDGHLVMLR